MLKTLSNAHSTKLQDKQN